MEDSPNKRKCSCCGRVFKSRVGCDEHIRVKHNGEAVRIAVGKSIKQDDEPSMASMFIEAEMNRAMGISNEQWIEDMLP